MINNSIVVNYINPQHYLKEIKKLWLLYYTSEPYNFIITEENLERYIDWRFEKKNYIKKNYIWVGVFYDKKLVCIYSYSDYYDLYKEMYLDLYHKKNIRWEDCLIIRHSVNDPNYRKMGVTKKAIEFIEDNIFKIKSNIIAPVYDMSLVNDVCRKPYEYYSKMGYTLFKNIDYKHNNMYGKTKNGEKIKIGFHIMIKSK